MNLLLLFVVLNVLNTVIGTKKSTATINGGVLNASVWNGLSYGVNTICVIYMTCELNLYVKALIVALCNFIGVFIVKTVDKKLAKDKMWKIELFGSVEHIASISKVLNDGNIKYSICNTNNVNYQYINAYCYTKEQSEDIKSICKFYNVKYTAIESKAL